MHLRRHGSAFGRKEATDIYVNTVTSISDEAAEADSLAGRAQQTLISAWRDATKGRRMKTGGGSVSTAWHRASSRVETYTDIGILTKGKGEASELFEYRYHPTERLGRLVDTLMTYDSPQEWLEEGLFKAFIDGVPRTSALSWEELALDIEEIVASLDMPVGLLPIETAGLSLCVLRKYRNDPITLPLALNKQPWRYSP